MNFLLNANFVNFVNFLLLVVSIPGRAYSDPTETPVEMEFKLYKDYKVISKNIFMKLEIINTKRACRLKTKFVAYRNRHPEFGHIKMIF